MIGAIIGDIVGSRFEFNNIKTKYFDLFAKNSVFTDDTVMTIAVADWFMNAKNRNSQREAVEFLHKWGRKFPDVGYGSSFVRWLLRNDYLPYNSCGNGAAMRISPVGFLSKSEDMTKKMSNVITGTTHNHPEGLKGAECTAVMIYRARKGASKEELKEYALSVYPEIADLDYEELRRTYEHNLEICQLTLPQAIYCFLISENFEDCLRTTISIGGDCDTTAAISCAIAEAYYKYIPEDIVREAKSRLTPEMLAILEQAENMQDI